MQFQLLNIEIQSVQVCWICTPFKYNQTQFRRVEVPSLRNHIVHPRLFYPSYESYKWIFQYFLIFLVNIWSENSISVPKHPQIMYFEYGCLVGLHIKEVKKQRRGRALMSNLVSHRWYDMEKLTVPGSSNLNLTFSGAQKKTFFY